MANPRVVIAGFGRVGGSLQHALSARGWNVSVLPMSAASRSRAKRAHIEIADLAHAELCFLTVPDGAVREVARKIHTLLPDRTALIHCAGALTLDAFGALPRPRGSFHPLCAVSDRRTEFDGHAAAVAATSPALTKQLERVARALGMKPMRVAERDRAQYHAGAVLGAGMVVALGAAAEACFRAAGVRDPAAALMPLMRSAIEGAAKSGFAAGVTGPIVRGDVDTVAAHLEALPATNREVYRVLALQTLALARLPRNKREALRKLLSR